MREMAVFAMLGALAFCSKLLMEFVPNIHFLGMFTMLFALAYGKKGLIPTFLFIFLIGLYYGFGVWWVPYLYLWPLLFGITLLLPKHMSPVTATAVYMLINGLFGLLFGTLYAPFQALVYHFDFAGMVAWIVEGFPYDVLHGIGNAAAAMLLVPLLGVIRRVEPHRI